jgi:hypothetical protein
MKKLIAATVALVASAALNAQSVYVQPHVRSNGTVVQGHWRTAPNSIRTDNWSSRPNINPMTGQAGRVDPYAPRTIYRAPSQSYPNPYRRGY